jgi:uncharacterized protein YnzC (UPF0291/DUF896 family)
MGMMDDAKGMADNMSQDQARARIDELSNKANTQELTDAEREELSSLRARF